MPQTRIAVFNRSCDVMIYCYVLNLSRFCIVIAYFAVHCSVPFYSIDRHKRIFSKSRSNSDFEHVFLVMLVEKLTRIVVLKCWSNKKMCWFLNESTLILNGFETNWNLVFYLLGILRIFNVIDVLIRYF